MTEAQFLTIINQMFVLVLQMAAPVLIISVVIGLIISVFQAVTQIQEATLTFVPKIIGGIVTLIVLMPWMLEMYITTIRDVFGLISTM